MKERLRMRGFLVPESEPVDLDETEEDGDEPFDDDNEEA
jgi:hypothetical protein